jgi:hypothetical protein
MSSVSGCWTVNPYGRSAPMTRCRRVPRCSIGWPALGRTVIHDGSFWASTRARAREAQAELYADDIIEIADSADEDKINSARLKIDARKWVVTRLIPRYAKKLTIEGGEKPVAVELNLREAARQIVRILDKAAPKNSRRETRDDATRS